MGSNVNLLDIIVASVVVGSALLGAFRGMIMQVCSVASFLAAFLVASRWSPVVADYLAHQTKLGGLEGPVAYSAVFLGVMATGNLLGLTIRLALRKLQLGWMDRLGGAALGLAKALVLCLILAGGATWILPQDSPAMVESQTLPALRWVAEGINDALPEGFWGSLQERVREQGIDVPGVRLPDLKQLDEPRTNSPSSPTPLPQASPAPQPSVAHGGGA